MELELTEISTAYSSNAFLTSSYIPLPWPSVCLTGQDLCVYNKCMCVYSSRNKVICETSSGLQLIFPNLTLFLSLNLLLSVLNIHFHYFAQVSCVLFQSLYFRFYWR